jgi:hypothetical protein
MIEDFIYDLTNRGSGFVWARFPVDPTFLPKALPDYAERVRVGLKLDDTSSDYYLVGALGALLGCPWVGEQVGTLEDLMPLATFSPPPDAWVGGELKAGPLDPATFALMPEIWPVELTTTLTFFDSQRAVLRSGDLAEYVAVALNPNGRLKVDWPSRFRARGVIDLSVTWESGASILIQHHPSAYPYRQAAEHLGGLRETNQLLLRSGLAAGWHAARSDMERVALLALGLIRTYRSA